MPAILRLVLGDQISDGRLSSLRDLDAKHDTVLLAEVRDEATYVKHHKQKIALVFAGMRGLAERLRKRKVHVRSRQRSRRRSGALTRKGNYPNVYIWCWRVLRR